MARVHTAYRHRMAWVLASACALGCGSDRVTPSLTSVTPARICGSDAAALALAGDGFEARVVGLLGQPTSESPTVTATAGSGSPVVLPSRWLSAAALAVDVPSELLAVGVYDLAVTNPNGARALLPQSLTRVASPRVDNATPNQLCAGGGDFTVDGANFVAGAAVALTDGATTLPGSNVVVAAATQLTVHLPANGFADNARLDLTVTNPDGCAGTLASALKRKTGAGGCP